MENWTILPFAGLGNLRLGSPRAAVHDLLGPDYKTFAKAGQAGRPTEAYDGLGLHLYYGETEQLEFIEAFHPCVPEYAGVRFLNRSVKEVVGELERLGFQVRYDNEGYYLNEQGFALYAPHGVVEAVSVFIRDYYR